MTDRRPRGSVSTDATTEPDAALRVRGLVKRYDDRAAVDGLDLEAGGDERLGELAAAGPTSLTSRPPTLEELFLRHYDTAGAVR